MDKAFPSEGRDQRFESSRVHQRKIIATSRGVAFSFALFGDEAQADRVVGPEQFCVLEHVVGDGDQIDQGLEVIRILTQLSHLSDLGGEAVAREVDHSSCLVGIRREVVAYGCSGRHHRETDGWISPHFVPQVTMGEGG